MIQMCAQHNSTVHGPKSIITITPTQAVLCEAIGGGHES